MKGVTSELCVLVVRVPLLAWTSRGQVYTSMGRSREAEADYHSALKLNTRYARAFSALVSMMKTDPHCTTTWDDIVPLIQTNLRSVSSVVGADLSLDNTKATCGASAENVRMFRSLLQGKGAQAQEAQQQRMTAMEDAASYHFCLHEYYHSLARRREKEGDSVASVADEGQRCATEAQAAPALRALSASSDELVEHAWRHLALGNDLEAARRPPYDKASSEMQITQYLAVFDRGFFRDGLGSPSQVPVFVVGMMRSGSTLVEQILNAHSKGFGIGEDSVFNGNLPAIRDNLVTALGWNDVARTQATILQEAQGVVAAMRSRVPAGRAAAVTRIVDKMLFNFRNIGFIHLVFPRAVIIHTVRNFWDVIFSCYRHKFEDSGLEYSLSVDDLVHFSVLYRRIMRHWERVLPGRIITVQYEDMVSNPRPTMERVLARCGLEWEDGVENFHDVQDRVVHTFSAHQVRSKIYSSAVGSESRYHAWLKREVYASPSFTEIRQVVESGVLNWVTNDQPLFAGTATLVPTPTSTLAQDEPPLVTVGVDASAVTVSRTVGEGTNDHASTISASVTTEGTVDVEGRRAELAALNAQKALAVEEEDFETAIVLKRKIKAIRAELEAMSLK